MTKKIDNPHNASIDMLLARAHVLGLTNAVAATTAYALRSESTYSHIFGDSAGKLLSRHNMAMQADREFAKTLILAGFGLPYKNGIQFRGMMGALARDTPVNALRDFSYDPRVTVELICAYRHLSNPGHVGKKDEKNVTLDCSLAINDPILSLRASGHYITQFASLLKSPEIAKYRQDSESKVDGDLSLIGFAREFIDYEIAANPKVNAAGNSANPFQGQTGNYVRNTFLLAAPYIISTASGPEAQLIHKGIINEGRNKENAPTFLYEAVMQLAKTMPPKKESIKSLPLNFAA